MQKLFQRLDVIVPGMMKGGISKAHGQHSGGPARLDSGQSVVHCRTLGGRDLQQPGGGEKDLWVGLGAGNEVAVGHRVQRMLGKRYGKAGSFEGFCSGGGIAQLGRTAALEALQGGHTTGFCGSYAELDSITAKTIGDAADAGDPSAVAVYRECGHYLGRLAAILIDLLNPEKIVIGSIFVRSEHLIRSAMQEVIDRECIPAAAAACSVVPAALGEALGDIAALSVASL